MTALDAFRREIDVFIDQELGDGARALFVATARQTLEQFEQAWRERYRDATFDRRVDGSSVKALEDVQSGGVVSERVITVLPIVRRALELFDLMVRVVTGGYKAQTFLFSEGARVGSVGGLGSADDFVVLANVSDFARPAEQRGFNLREGVFGAGGLFESMAAILQREFAESANAVYFTYRTIEGNRVPVLAIGGAAQFAGIRRGGQERDNDPGKRRRDREAKRRSRSRRRF